IEPLDIRHFLALQFVEKGEALGADPRNHCKLETVRALQILDIEEACVGQSPGTSERQTSALPCLGSAPVLVERRRFGPARQVPHVNPLGYGFGATLSSAPTTQEILGL